MVTFLLRRTGYYVFVLLGVLLIVFMLIHLTGDPVSALVPITAGPEVMEALTRQLRLDEPLYVQFYEFVKRAAVGDFGMSVRHRAPALGLVLERAVPTLKLGLVGLGFALAISLPLGTVAGLRKGSWMDQLARAVAVMGQAIPNFWLAIVLILVFGVTLGWLPISGTGTWKHLVLPGIVVGLAPVPGITRILRSSLIEVLDRDYIRTARSKGLGEARVFLRHALRNSSIPVVSLLSFQVAWLLSGALVAEVIFAYPGMGRLAYQAIVNRDIAVIQAFVFVNATAIVLTNMLLDVVYSALDPRVRVG